MFVIELNLRGLWQKVILPMSVLRSVLDIKRMFRSNKAWDEANKVGMKQPSSEDGILKPPDIQTQSMLNLLQPQSVSVSNSSMQAVGAMPNSSLLGALSSIHSHLQPSQSSPNFPHFRPPLIWPPPQLESVVPSTFQVNSTPFLSSLQNMTLPVNSPCHVQDSSLLARMTYRERSSSLSSSESQLRPSSSESTQSEKEARQLSATPSKSSMSDDEDSDDDNSHHNSKYEVEIIDTYGNIRKKQNMSVVDVMKMQEGERIKVDINERGQPIRGARGVLTRWITLHVRQPNICPPDAKDFREVRKLVGIQLLRMVREKFVFPNHDNVDNVLMALFGAKYRNNRYKTIKRFFKDAANQLKEKAKKDMEVAGYDTASIEKALKEGQFSYEQLEDELENLPRLSGYSDLQWKKLLSYIKSDAYKKLSVKGKEARASLAHLHTTGTKSFAAVEDE